MADERDRGWRARLARRIRPRRTPDDQLVVRPLTAVGWMLATVIAVVGVTAGVWLWLRGVADQAAPGTAQAQAQLSAARIALAAGGGAGAGVGLMLAFRRQQHQEKATVLTDRDAVERRINDRYTAAIDQLGSDKLDVRLGGIYALERIAADSRRDHPTVIDVLCTFVREHTRADASDDPDPVLADWMAADDPPQSSESTPVPPAADVQAALTVVGRRTSEYDTRVPDLHSANLEKANLEKANLDDANLDDANLDAADLDGANLSSTSLARAKLTRATLEDANLRNAILSAAHLTGANLTAANLNGAFLIVAHLDDANLTGANLTAARLYRANLHGSSLRGAILSNAALGNADLGNTDLGNTDLSGADLSGADLSGSRRIGAKHDSRTRWPDGFAPPPQAERPNPPTGDPDA